ncbi:MAG: hypothetical protein FJ035_09915 [Chloroflexi bacterium]|nr:hypothetical protein [Chloroflexota bacterium]
MPVRSALLVAAGGKRFRFYYDLEVPELLHIVLRHGTTPDDAIRTYFEDITSAWDGARARYATTTSSHVLHQTRHTRDQSVIVISCFEQEDR